jgi:hypothetical protein
MVRKIVCNTSKKGHKPHFVLDVNADYPEFSERYGKIVKFYTVTEVTGRESTGDDDIFTQCNVVNKHLVTKNFRHFRKDLKSSIYKNSGVVSIETQNISKAVEVFGKMIKEYPYHEDYKKKCIRITSTKYTEIPNK